jgi:predicted nucleic acid-binding protein
MRDDHNAGGRGLPGISREDVCMTGYMFDTNVFNRILEHQLDISYFPSAAEFYVTHIQRDEIGATRNDERRRELLATFAATPAASVPTESAMYGVSKWNECKWSSEDGKFQQMLESLNRLNSSKHNNGLDILIGETALRNGYIVITDDSDLATVVREFHGRTMVLTEFLSLHSHEDQRLGDRSGEIEDDNLDPSFCSLGSNRPES